VRKSSRDQWRAFCNSIEDLPKAARLHRALCKDPAIGLGLLVTPSGENPFRGGYPEDPIN
jgi:hypothetical protein